eukprot:14473702-Alexandrium_andersonii.AAC.1
MSVRLYSSSRDRSVALDLSAADLRMPSGRSRVLKTRITLLKISLGEASTLRGPNLRREHTSYTHPRSSPAACL